MSSKYIVVSEWLPKKHHEEALFSHFKALARTTLEKESGCLQYLVTRQMAHPKATGESKFNILLIQEYDSIHSFDSHCSSAHVLEFAQKHLAHTDTGLVDHWRCRMFSED